MTDRERRAEFYAKGPQRYRYALVAIAVPLLLAAILWGLRHEYYRSEGLRAAAARSYDRRIQQIQMLSRLKDAETAQRGYLLTGDARFLEPYRPAETDLEAQLRAMREHPDPELPTDYTARISSLAASKVAEMNQTILLVQRGQTATARAMVADGRGKDIMDSLRVAIGGAIAREEVRSKERSEAFLAQRRSLSTIIIGIFGALTLMLLIFLVSLWRSRNARYAAVVEAFEAAERNQTILDSTIDAIVILNPSGTVEVMNASATSLLGYGRHELERRDIATIIDLAPGEGSFHKRVGLIDGQLRRSFLTDRRVKHRDGREIAVDVAMGVMRVPSGDHIVVSLRDISERKRIERVKDELMSTVSHELRTPLTSIVGSLGLLKAGTAGELPQGAGRLVEIAENNSRRLIRLINDMLDIDRIESGKLDLARDPIDLRPVIEQACVGSEGLARSSGVHMHCDMPDQPVMVSGDSDRLLQVVTNLMSNAIRVSPKGERITLTLSIDDDRNARVAIEDRGPGVPAAFRERIFGRFERASSEEGSTGTGLGLAISREIVSRHDGAIWFEDRPGGGASFIFTLALIGRTAQLDDQAARVLICEHDEEVAAALVAIVINEGCAYDLVRNVAEARIALSVGAYAALLIDLNLPEEGGLAFAREARDRNPPIKAPIIVVTPGAIDDDGFSPLDVVDWLDKPNDAGRIADAVRHALRGGSNRERPVVLHLDDDRDLLSVVATALEPEVRVVAATNLASARAMLEHMSPDAVILDIRLENESGLDLIPFLYDADGIAIPTIIFSAQDVAGDLAAKVDAVLVKARGSIPDLKATVRRVVRTRDGRRS